MANSEYEKAQEKLAWAKQCSQYVIAAANAMTSEKCPLNISAKDFDIFVKQMQEAVSEAFYEETSEAERLIEQHDRADYSAMRRELSTREAV